MTDHDFSEERESLWLICNKQTLLHTQCYEFALPLDEINVSTLLKAEAFILNWQGVYYAYQNSCPHTGVTLNWKPNQFFDQGSSFLQCGMHGALFEPTTGYCVHGPCRNQSLKILPLQVCGENLYLDLKSVQ